MKLKVFGYTIDIESKALEDETIPQDLKDALKVIEHYGVKIQSTEKQKRAAEYATKIRQDRVKQKIQNAINLLHRDGEKITAYKVAKVAGISYNTARKYLEQNKSSKE